VEFRGRFVDQANLAKVSDTHGIEGDSPLLTFLTSSVIELK
jgi:hypothetical protein